MVVALHDTAAFEVGAGAGRPPAQQPCERLLYERLAIGPCLVCARTMPSIAG
jgi:hypothetical protein